MDHWNGVYARRAPHEVSWFESVPVHSLEAIESIGLDPSSAIIDIGGGASTLVDELTRRGFRDLSVLDISRTVLENVRNRLGSAVSNIDLIEADITGFKPARAYAVWHDRAVFHFLTVASDRDAYRRALREGTSTGSHVLISTFGPEGPQRCSGLETMRYDAAGLAREIGPEFRLIESDLAVHTTPSGSQQQFLHARFARL
jgi:hypothetical protein